MTTKTCNTCQKEKPLAEFYAHPRTKDKRQQRCKACSRKALDIIKHQRRLENAFVRLHAQAERLREAEERANALVQ